MRFRNPAGHAGLFNNIVSLANSLAGFFESRLHLFAAESKGALVHLVLLLAALIGALILIITGYIFLVVSAIFAIAFFSGISWIWIALATAGLNFLLAIGCGLFARSQMKKPMFAFSMAELKRDREWLKKVNQTHESTS